MSDHGRDCKDTTITVNLNINLQGLDGNNKEVIDGLKALTQKVVHAMSQILDRLNELKAKAITEATDAQTTVARLTEELRVEKEKGGNDPEALAVIAEIETIIAGIDTTNPATIDPAVLEAARAKLAQARQARR